MAWQNGKQSPPTGARRVATQEGKGSSSLEVALAQGIQGAMSAAISSMFKPQAAASTTRASTARQQGWACRCSDCEYAQKGRLNWADRLECRGCCRPKAKACNPPPHARISTNGKSNTQVVGVVDKGKARRDKRAARRKEAQQAKDNVAKEELPVTQPVEDMGVVALAMAEVEEAKRAGPATKLVLPKRIIEGIPLILPALAPVIEGLEQEYLPQPPKDKSSAEEIVAKIIGDKAPCAKLAKKSALEADIRRYEAAILALGDSDSMAEEVEGLRTKLDATRVMLAKVAKATPSLVHEHVAIKEARTRYELGTQDRLDREQRGAAKGATRRGERLKHVTALKEQLAVAEKALAEVEANHVKEFTLRAEAAAELDAAVFRLLDARLAETEPPGFDSALAVNDAMTDFSATPDTTDTDKIMSELLESKRRCAELQRQLASAASVVHQAPQLATIMNDFEFVVEGVCADDLPQPSIPEDPSELATYGHTWYLLNNWMSAGSHVPFTWEAFKGQASPEVDMMVKRQMGQLWNKWYADDARPAGIVPRQMAFIMFRALEAMKGQYDAGGRESAATSYAVLRDSHKRLRATAASAQAI